MAQKPERQRLDKFLWQARFFKTRAMASEIVSAGKVRVNGTKVAKPSHPVRIGDGLTFPQAGEISVVRVTGLPVRRGPASEAQAMYQDLTATDGSLLSDPS